MPNDLSIFLLLISPILVLTAGAVVLVLLSTFFKAPRNAGAPLFISALVLASGLSFWLMRNGVHISTVSHSAWFLEFRRHYNSDDFSFAWLFVSNCFLLLGGALFSRGESDSKVDADLKALILFSGVGISLLITASSLPMIFLGLEFLSLPIYALVGSRRQSLQSLEAGLKYFLFGALGSVLLLLAIAILYMGSASIYFADVERYLASTNRLTMGLGVGLFIGVIGFKLGIAPFNSWVPDAYQGAPTAITGVMGSAVKLGAIVMGLRLFWGPLLPAVSHWSPLLIVVALLSMAFGSFGGLVQRDLKRLLAYSSITHAGYLLLAVAVAPKHLDSVFIWFYMFTYGVMFLGAFGAISLVERATGRSDLNSIAGIGFSSPVISLPLAMIVVSAAGIPPLAGFTSKYLLFLQVVRSGHIWPAVIGLVLGIVSMGYYLRILVQMYMAESFDKRVLVSADWVTCVLVALSAAFLLVVGVSPDLVLK